MLMHEGMIAQNLLAIILQHAEEHNAKPTAARISCGKLYAVNDEALCFAFDALAQGTSCEGMQLQIEHKPLQAHCKSCSETFNVDFAKPKCPNCEKGDFELLPDAPLILEEIEFEELPCNDWQKNKTHQE